MQDSKKFMALTYHFKLVVSIINSRTEIFDLLVLILDNLIHVESNYELA